jgi:putative endonuclease
MRYTVYVLLSPEGKMYVGQTADLSRRLRQHNDPEFHGTLHTERRSGPWCLVHEEQFPSRSAGMRRERELKSGRGRDWIRQHLAGDC